jgi:uncharacterized repeat protein (TIGR03803 family)
MRNERQKGNDGAGATAAGMGAWLRGPGLLCLVLAATMTSPAQDDRSSASKAKFKVLVNIDTPPLGQNTPLAQGTDGNLYGSDVGTLFSPLCSGPCTAIYRMTPAGTQTTIYNFCSQPNCADGWIPAFSPLALGTDGNFYGVTQYGGLTASSGPCAPVGGCGTIFKITPNGALTVLYNMCSQPNCADGSGVFSGVVLGPDGNFYGTTVNGGTYSNSMCVLYGVGLSCGTVYKITPQGAFTTLYNFCSQTNCTDGASPYPALTVGADGNLYGLAAVGGANGDGTIFKLTLGGTLTTLHSFDGTDGGCFGIWCQAPLVQDPNGNFYGVTGAGGTGVGAFGNAGVFFRITPSGAYTLLYDFCSLANCTDGDVPDALVYADGNFYGTALAGGNTNTPICGNAGCGTLFKISPEGVLATLHTFGGTTDGFVEQNLTQATSGIFYGADDAGGTYNDGTIYALSAGLSPFAETVPTSGKIGETIQILGNDLTEATSVSFNGTPAVFTVDSKTLISATVPAGATAGFVTVTGPNATLKSNVEFQVRP